MLKAVTIAQELCVKDSEDYFLIKDACLAELDPEEVDENGLGRVPAYIRFRPVENNIAYTTSKKISVI